MDSMRKEIFCKMLQIFKNAMSRNFRNHNPESDGRENFQSLMWWIKPFHYYIRWSTKTKAIKVISFEILIFLSGVEGGAEKEISEHHSIIYEK